MSLRILADENIPAVEHYAAGLGTVRRFSGRALQAAQLADVDVLLIRSVTRVDATLLASCPGLRFVGTATSGFDHVDRVLLRERGIGFAHAPGSNANSVVEYVLAAIAAVGDHLERILSGTPVGIIGCGVIGTAVAARLDALGVDYRMYDPWLPPGALGRPAELPAVLECGVITLHAELTQRQPWPSYHLLDGDSLAGIPSSSLLINASRGAVVDNAALGQVLAAAGSPEVVLDVWEGEPAIDPALLRRVVLGTPHIAGYSLDGKLLATRMLVAAMATELALPWDDPGSAAGAPPALLVPAACSDAELLRAILAQRYDIRADDHALRAATMGVGQEAAASGFDRLRRNYPDRREVLASPVAAGRLSAPARRLLQALGCALPEPGV